VVVLAPSLGLLVTVQVIVTGFSQPPGILQTNSREPVHDTLMYHFTKSAECSKSIFYPNVLHMYVIDRPNFEENGRIFEVVMNG